MENIPKHFIQSEVTGEWIEVDKELFDRFNYFGKMEMDKTIYGTCDRKTDELLKEMGI